MVNRPRTFSSLQVNSHANRGWWVGSILTSGLQSCKDFDARFDIDIQISLTNLEPDGWRLLDDVPIAHLYDPLTHGRSFRIVSDHDDGLIEPVVQLLEHVKDKS